jgi:broad specificity phosphatase PhoE
VNIVYLVRHGENPANLTREFSHRRVDYALTPRGVEQARRTAHFFRDRRVDAIYTSPLRRARETAEIIAAPHGLPVWVIEGFREINVGELEVRPPTDANWALHDAVQAAWRAGRHEEAFPGGENYIALLARMRAGLDEALRGRDGQRIVIVGHGGIVTATIADLCAGMRADDAFAAPTPNCAITTVEVERRDGRLVGRLVEWASCAHLDE